eukprot:TRINITY_DN2193_c2_g2_i5.p1 TRINITY_DN2193_c2_g2~~TRINITY_DN2193_c2_g2_i5.p1  ORF type:complete len:1016 (+),score=384.23 TRINITY_DN2193_c2_g2_i5:316-3363(+)
MLVGGQLKEYQMAGLQWLVSLYNNKLNGILADEMGLGKTIQTIALVANLIERKADNGPYLIIVPLSTMSNWSGEFAKWAPTIVTIIYKGKPAEREALFRSRIKPGKFNVLLTSFEYIMKDKAFLSTVRWCYIILDEGHRIKNKNSKLSIMLRMYHTRHRLLLTGTPLQNDLGELWSLLNFLLPTIFNSQDTFEQWFNAPFQAASGTIKITKKTKAQREKKEQLLQVNEEEQLIIVSRLHQVLRPFLLRRLKQDVESQLPDKVERVLKCNLSAMQYVMYKQLCEHGSMMVDPSSSHSKKTTRGFNNIWQQLQKVCNHPYLFLDEYDIDENLARASGKFWVLDNILTKMCSTGHRTLIFTQMVQIIDIMMEYFPMRGYDPLKLDGSTKQEDREDLIKRWNMPNSPHNIFILSTHAGGLGLNLQTADTVIIFDTDWNPQMDLQAQARAHRIGQTQEVRVFRLVTSNSIEEKVVERAEFKLNMDAKVIQAGLFNQQSTDEMRRDMLQTLMTGYGNEDDPDEAIDEAEQFNRMIARSDKEVEIFQKMDKEREDAEMKMWREKNPGVPASKLGPPPPRLMAEDELPRWMVMDPGKVREQERIAELGKGKRRRNEVSYADNLTDMQWVRMVEKGKLPGRKTRSGAGDDAGSDSDDSDDEGDMSDEEDDVVISSSDEEARPRRKAVPVKKTATPNKGRAKRGTTRSDSESEAESSGDEGEDIVLDDDDEATAMANQKKKKKEKEKEREKRRKEKKEEASKNNNDDSNNNDAHGDTPRPRKRGRPPGAKNKPKAEEVARQDKGSEDDEGGPKKRKRNPTHKAAGSDKEESKKGKEKELSGLPLLFHDAMKRIRSYRSSDSGRVVSLLFRDLPDRDEYPDYYEEIDNPISMRQIQSRHASYTTVDAWANDWLVMLQNARQYNEEGSEVYEDAEALEKLFLTELAQAKNNVAKGLLTEGNKTSTTSSTSSSSSSSSSTSSSSSNGGDNLAGGGGDSEANNAQDHDGDLSMDDLTRTSTTTTSSSSD